MEINRNKTRALRRALTRGRTLSVLKALRRGTDPTLVLDADSWLRTVALPRARRQLGTLQVQAKSLEREEARLAELKPEKANDQRKRDAQIFDVVCRGLHLRQTGAHLVRLLKALMPEPVAVVDDLETVV